MKLASSVRGLAGLALVVALVVPGSASAAFTPPQILTGNGDMPQIDVNQHGAAVAAWRTAGSIEAAYRPAGGEWEASQQVSFTNQSITVGDPTLNPNPVVAISGDGSAVVVYQGGHESDPNAPGQFIYASVRRPTTTAFAPAQQLTGSGVEPDVAGDGSGNFVVVWRGNTIRQRTLQTGQLAFDALDEISPPGVDALRPQVDVGRNGTTTAAWVRNNIIEARTREGGFGANFPGGDPEQISELPSSDNASQPDVAVDPLGSSFVTWIQANEVRAAKRAPGAGFGSFETIQSAGALGIRRPRVAVDSGGIATFLYLKGPEGARQVEVRHRNSDSTLGDPVNFPQDGDQTSSELDVAEAGPASGKAVIVWQRPNGAGPDGGIFAVERAQPTSGYGPIQTISGFNSEMPDVGVADDGVATVIYKRGGSLIEVSNTVPPPPGSRPTCDAVTKDVANSGPTAVQLTCHDVDGNLQNIDAPGDGGAPQRGTLSTGRDLTKVDADTWTVVYDYTPNAGQAGQTDTFTFFGVDTAPGPSQTATIKIAAAANPDPDPDPDPPAVPQNTTRPSINNPRGQDPARVGDVLSAFAGVWTNAPTRYRFSWFRCTGTGTRCVGRPAQITSVTGTSNRHSYTLQDADEGLVIVLLVTAINGDGESESEEVGLALRIGPEPSFYEEVFALRNFRLLPAQTFPIVLDFMPYRGKQVRRGLYNASKSVCPDPKLTEPRNGKKPKRKRPKGCIRDTFPDNPVYTDVQRRLAKTFPGQLSRRKVGTFWTKQQVKEAMVSLADRNVFVRLTLNARPYTAVPEIWKYYIQPYEVFSQDPRPAHQKADGFASNAANPPRLEVSYWDPSLDPKKKDPPPQVTKSEESCPQLQNSLVPYPGKDDPGWKVPFDDRMRKLSTTYATKKPPCFATFRWEAKGNVDSPVIGSARRSGDEELEVVVWTPKPTQSEPRIDLIDLLMTVTPLPNAVGKTGSKRPTFDENWRLTTDTVNGFRMQVKDKSLPLGQDGKLSGPFGGVTIQAWFDGKGGEEEYGLIKGEVNGQEVYDIETGQRGSREPGQATVHFKLPKAEGRLRLTAFARPARGEVLDGWVSFDVVKRSKCFAGRNGWSFTPSKGDWKQVASCGSKRPSGGTSTHLADFHDPWLSAYCFLVCWTDSNLRAKLIREEAERDAAAAQRETGGGGSDCNTTTPAVTSAGGHVEGNPAPGDAKSTPVTVLGGGQAGGGTMATGLDLGKDGVAATAVTGCVTENNPINVTNATSVPVPLLNQDTGSFVPTSGGNVIASGGGNVIASGGGNVIASGGGNVIASGGGNVIASGGGNVIASGGGN